MTPLTYTVAEAARAAGISRSFAYRLISRGQFPARRIGRRLVVPVAQLEAYLSP
jgi:excisionase family DNA binding protein